ncbi:MAG: chromate transporter, partial [Acidobacteria bacterium]|nr:chromate transporter [Acidobacteriota bacterium]
ALFIFQGPFPLVILGAALAGFAGGRLRPSLFVLMEPGKMGTVPGSDATVDAILERPLPAHARPSAGRLFRVAAVHLLLWFAPIGLLAALLGPQDVFVKMGVFFSKAAVVTFGGAYAVLAYVAQQAVENFGWLRPGEMLDGLGMAETTPGPLIQVVQFVGFMGAYRNPGALPPMLAGTLGAVLTTWVTYVPCFLWIFLGAPYVEALRASKLLGAALSAITAAVVGVILNLTVWFGAHVLFADLSALGGPFGARLLVPVWSSVNPAALLIALAAFLAMNRLRVGMLPVLGASTLAGLLL